MTSLAADHATRMPVHVDHVHLAVRDLPMVSAFYRDMIGLGSIEKSESGEVLGVAGQPLLTLLSEKDAVIAPRNAPGLFHTAFLLPDRTELGRFLVHAAGQNVPLQGASDHLVSEALYLDDPEGNGIEIYRDRRRDEWDYLDDGTVKMATHGLDLQALYDETPKNKWEGMAPGTTIGHVHLKVSEVAQAEAFFRDALGLDLMATYPGAGFFASGRYHHHVAANIWNSRGAPKRAAGMTGLAEYSLRFNGPALLQTTLAQLDRLEIPVSRDGNSASLTDPWGMRLKLAA